MNKQNKTNRILQRWKRRLVRYRQKFQAYIAYIAIVALFSIVLPFIIYYHFEVQSLIFFASLSVLTAIYLSISKKEFADKASWTFIILVFPFFGVLLFLFIGYSQLQSRTYKRKIIVDTDVRSRYAEKLTGPLGFECVGEGCTNTFSHYRKIAPDASYTTGSKFEFLESQAVYDRMLEDILAAEKHIHLQVYIARFDETTKPIFDALKMKAKAGVEVRYLGDVFGHNLLREKDIEELIMSGIRFTFFNSHSTKYFDHFHINHRKMLIIDGDVGYTGGYNLGDEYVNGYPKKKLKWCDMMSRIEGNMVQAMQMMFLLDWTFSYQIPMETIVKGREEEFFPQVMETLEENGPITQFLGDGPDFERAKVQKMLRYLIAHAEHRIYITTPYLIPSDDLLKNLILAAQSGVDVQIIIPEVPDKKIVYYCSESYIDSLLSAGVKVFKMKDHFVHSKMYIFDFETSMFGTVNFDMRSFLLNFEDNIVQFNDEQTNAELLKIFERMKKDSLEITREEWKRRSFKQKFLETFFRAFAPLF